MRNELHRLKRIIKSSLGRDVGIKGALGPLSHALSLELHTLSVAQKRGMYEWYAELLVLTTVKRDLTTLKVDDCVRHVSMVVIQVCKCN